MRHWLLSLLVVVAAWSDVALAQEATGLKTVTCEPEITDEVLFNPGMGLFFMPHLGTSYEVDWFVPLVSVAYIRVGWYSLEPEEGVYKFGEVLDPVFQYWFKRGKRVALRVMSSSMHSRQVCVSPEWVFDAGVPGVEFKGLYIPRQVDPVFWHPLYMEKQAAFIQALGKKYDGMKGLEFVDLGCVGEWGESHLSRWSAEDKRMTGYTPTVYTKAYMRFLDLHCEAFADTPLALNCGTGGSGHNDVIVDYAVCKGVWLRQDGLKVGYPRGGASRYYHQYCQRVKTLYELCYGYRTMKQRGETMIDTFKRGFEDPISYLNMNLAGVSTLNKFNAEEREAVRYAAQHVGYRLAPVKIEHQQQINIDKGVTPRLWLSVTWCNVGAAPCYQHLGVDIALAADDGNLVFRAVEMPAKPTTQWLPREEVHTPFSLPLPRDLRPGMYTLNIGLVDALDDNRHILMPLHNKDSAGRYAVAQLRAARRATPLVAPQVPGGNFERADALAKWSFTQGIDASLVADDAPEGRQCLRIEGKTGKGWNYGNARTIPLMPGTEYAFSVRMKVLAIDNPGKPPYVKFGLADTDGRWFTNVHTSKYDTARLGTWQQLRGRFVTPAKTGGGTFAIEKGGTMPRDAVILLDDIRVQVLSAP